MPRRIAQLVAGSQGVAPAQGDTFTTEPFVATMYDQTGLAGLFSTVAPPTALTGADIVGGALTINQAYKWRATSLGPMGESAVNTTELAVTLGATGAGQTLTITQMAGATGYRLYRTNRTAAALTWTETLVHQIPRPVQVVTGTAFTVADFGTWPVTSVSVPFVDSTTLPAALGAPGTPVAGSGATTAGSTLPLLSAWQYKYTAVNFLGESPASVATATTTLTTTQNNITGITLVALAGAQYYNIYRAQVIASVVGPFTYLTTVNANNNTNLQVLTTFVDDGNYKGNANKQPPAVDGTGGAVLQPIGTFVVQPNFALTGTTGGCFVHPNCIDGQILAGFTYGVVVDPSTATSTVGNNQVLVAQGGVVNALVNTAANYYAALTSGSLVTSGQGPLTNSVVPGTPLMTDGCGHLCPAGVFSPTAAAIINNTTDTIPGQIVGYALGTVGVNQIQSIPVLLGSAV